MAEPASRTARYEDLFDDLQPTYDKNYVQNDKNTIAKNQQEFGNRKRIKP